MQTILGAGGVIGTELARSLPPFTDRIRLVGRDPRKVNPGDELFPADLLDAGQTARAVEGSELAYLTVGLPYKLAVWQIQWPIVMKNTIEACKRHGTKLVFFDNVYMYGKVDGWMTEDSPVRPVSRKGEVRAEIAGMLLDAVRRGDLKALIARSADFYGPQTPLSFVSVMVFDMLKNGKKAQWMVNDSARHSFTFTPDAGKATALLGNTDKAYGRVWHLPTDRNALSGRQFIEKAARAFGVAPAHMLLPAWMLKMVGLFNAIVRESIEMLYQSEADYLFDSTRFEQSFDLKATSYDEGIRETVRSMR